MKYQVAERRTKLPGQTESSKRRDIFTILVKANENELGKYRLNDEELVCHLIDGGSPFSDCSKRQAIFIILLLGMVLNPSHHVNPDGSIFS